MSFFIIAGISYWLFIERSTKNDALAIELHDSSVEGIYSVEKDNLLKSDLEMNKNIYVHICGAVNKAGVYAFYEGARIIEGIEEAGGFSNEADKEFLNLAQKMMDGEKIYIPTILQVQEGNLSFVQEQISSNEEVSGLININTATAKKLTELSGIGEKRAAAIIDYREKNGSFIELHDLTKVDGISESIYEALKDMITIGK